MKTKILYICGSGHSGSTLLDVILGTSKKCISVGEIISIADFIDRERLLARKKKGKNVFDDSGKLLKESVFWGKILRNLQDKRFHDKFQFTMKEKIQVLYQIFINNSSIEQYNDGELCARILDRAKDLKGRNVSIIVDSSKEIRRLVHLVNNKQCEVCAIHLFRDGRGVINSHEKTGHHFITSYFRWIIENSLLKLFLFFNVEKKNRLHLSYDLLTKDLEKYIKILNDKLFLSLDFKNLIESINSEISYRFAGNYMRKYKINRIRNDTSWRRRMPKWKQIVLTFLTYLPNKLWVYRDYRP